MTKCTFDNCQNTGRFALYELLEPEYGKPPVKVWRTDLCSGHEKYIHQRNRELQKLYPDEVWKEIK